MDIFIVICLAIACICNSVTIILMNLHSRSCKRIDDFVNKLTSSMKFSDIDSSKEAD